MNTVYALVYRARSPGPRVRDYAGKLPVLFFGESRYREINRYHFRYSLSFRVGLFSETHKQLTA